MSILIDSSAFIAYFNSQDPRHDGAVDLMDEATSGKWGATYCPWDVLDESVTFTRQRLSSSEAVRLGLQILGAFELLPTDDAVGREAWSLFQKQPKLSFTDCTILVLMGRHGIGYLLTFDKGFKGLVSTLGI